MSRHQPPLSLSTIVCARPGQVSSPVGEDLVILDLDSSMYYTLDPVGRRVFELLAGPVSLDVIRDAVVAEFDVDAETAGADLLALMDELVAQRLVEARTGDAR